MIKPKNLSISFFVLLIICFTLFQTACSDTAVEEPLIALANVSEIVALDNSNSGNGSDIEVNFDKQSETSDIREYRVFLTKTSSASTFDINAAQRSNTYERVLPEDIFRVQGLQLSSNFVDTEGDDITEQESYIISVLSVAKDSEAFSDAFLKTTTPFQIRKNNLIKNHTQVLDIGMGSLAIDDSDNLYMATNNVVSELSNDGDPTFPVFIISEGGDAQSFSQSFTVLGGNDIDSEGNLYQSILKTGSLLKINQLGESIDFINDNDDRGFKLESVDGVYVDDTDQVFVLELTSNSVVRINQEGIATQFARIPPHAKGITGDENGNLYINHNSEEGLITKVSSEGVVSELARVPTLFPQNYQLEFIQWLGYIKYHEDNLYVTSPSTNKVFRVSMNGDVSLFAGSGFRFKPRGGAITANLNRPHGLAFSQDGTTLYISGSADTEPRHTQSSAPSIVWSVELVE